MKIGYRTIKTAIGAALSVTIAQHFQLMFYASAGILTILCIKNTKKQSYLTAWERFLACVIGLSVAALFFESLGYHAWTLTLVLLVSIPLMVFLKTKEGVVASAVFIFHLYILKRVDLSIVLNELALIGIGIGIGLLFNLVMPNSERELQAYQKQVEENFRKILHEISRYLREGESDWNGKEIIETEALLKKAKQEALIYLENHLDPDERYYYRYFYMREKQFEILDHLIPTLTLMEHTSPYGEKIAEFLDQLAEGIHPGNTADRYLEALKAMKQDLLQQPLPTTQEEFQARSTLLLVLNEIERYLMVKKSLAEVNVGQKRRKPDA